MIKHYKNGPIVVSAIQWTGINLSEVKNFVGNDLVVRYYSTWEGSAGGLLGDLTIHTLQDEIHVKQYDYIVRGIHGKFFPCRSEEFNKIYKEV